VLNDAGYRTIAYDRRGFGRSDQPGSGFGYDTLSDDLAAVIDAVGERQVTLVGYSMGGGEIIRYLSRHGAREVAGIVLVGTIVPGLIKGEHNPRGADASEFDGIKAALKADRASFIGMLLRDLLYDVNNANTTPVTPDVIVWSCTMAAQASLTALLACVDTFGRTDLRDEMVAVTVPRSRRST
jgi:non-heme chloroperoxidase